MGFSHVVAVAAAAVLALSTFIGCHSTAVPAYKRVRGDLPRGFERTVNDYNDLCTTINESPIIKDIFEQNDLPYNHLGATIFALLYGYGFASYEAGIKGAAGIAAIGTNKIYSTGKLTTPGVSSVIRPNVDTIYAAAIIDLSDGDVEIEVPEPLSDHYYLHAFYDPYGDNYAGFGSRYSSRSGKYLLRSTANTGEAGLTTDSCVGYQSCVDSPTYNGLYLVRVEVKRNDTEELKSVNEYLDLVKLNTINNHLPSVQPLTALDFLGLPVSFPEKTLTLTARLASRNPPQDIELARVVPKVLAYAGIQDGVFIKPASVDLTDAYDTLNTTLTNFYASPASRQQYANGWSSLSDTYVGSYENGTDIVARAFVAEQGYGANTPDQSIYPFPPEFTYNLPAHQALLITFVGGKPPLLSDGFWSLTLYDANGNLLPNPQEVYALGDRSNLTYPDGSLVYEANKTFTESEPFQILVQPQDEMPPANWTSNWLPGPAGGGPFQITLRFYAEQNSLTNRAYIYPEIHIIDAVRE